jgi:hypothetical protein
MPHVARVHGEARACLDASSSAVVGRPAAEELDSFLTALGNGFLFGLGDPVAQELDQGFDNAPFNGHCAPGGTSGHSRRGLARIVERCLRDLVQQFAAGIPAPVPGAAP